jgi:hypothetical protein
MSTPEEIENKAKRLMEAAEGESSRSKIILFATQIDECLEALLKSNLKTLELSMSLDTLCLQSTLRVRV